MRSQRSLQSDGPRPPRPPRRGPPRAANAPSPPGPDAPSGVPGAVVRPARTRTASLAGTAFALASLLAWEALAQAEAPLAGRPRDIRPSAQAGRAASAPPATTPADRPPEGGAGSFRDPTARPAPLLGRPDPSSAVAQAGPTATLPTLVLPPGASTEPPMFASLMRTGDTAMVRGDIMRARALYERAATIHPASSEATIAAGKTYDPNVLPLFGGGSNLADTARAREWYERARALGDPAAAALLSSLR